MSSIASPRLRGSVTLVALCFVAVLGIGLASYLAVTNQSMKLSNRSYVTGVSGQVAEMGLEQALWSFNQNDWSSWTISGNTATRTITFPSTKYGNSGLTAAINLRVDNYNAYNLPSIWTSVGGVTNYRVNDLVGNTGMWYRCVQAHTTTQIPATVGTGTLAYWVPAPIPWMWIPNYSYKVGDVINTYNGTSNRWYRCTTAHTSPTAWTVTNWTLINSISLYSTLGTYVDGDIVYYPDSTTWYLYHSGNWATPPGISWQWKSATSYNFDDLVCVYDSISTSYIWYRCILAHTNHVPPNTTYWEDALSGSTVATSGWGWNSGYNYNLGDVVYRNGSFYRCILAHTNQGPPNATYWSNAPLKSKAWDPGRPYVQYDTASYNGTWHLCWTANSGQIPPSGSSSTSYWRTTADSSYQWNAATAYTTSSYVSYGGVWYHCISANTNITPNNSTYWTALGAPVIYAQGTATLPDGSATIKTQLRATVAQAPLFPNAAAATTSLTLGAGGTVDSYDGSVNAITTQGSFTTYAYQQTTSPFAASPSWNQGYSAVLAASGTTSPAVTVTSTTVKGYVAAPSATTTPYAPIWTYGGSAVLTGIPSGSGIDLTRVSRSPYIPQFDTLPSGGLTAAFAASSFSKGTLLVLSTATTNIGTPGATTPSRYYYSGTLTLNQSSPTILNIDGPVILYISGDLLLDGDGTTDGVINITSTGSAEIHVAGGLRVLQNSDGIRNYTLDPKKLIVICDTAAGTTQNYGDGGYPFYGVIYAPNTTNSTGLNFNNTAPTATCAVYGAVSAKKIAYDNAAYLHYDTSLRYATFGGVEQPCIINEWRELTDPAERATLP